MLTRPRAVKMLKAGASKAAKEEYLHECRMLLKCGAGVSRSVRRSRPVSRVPYPLCLMHRIYCERARGRGRGVVKGCG